MENLESLIYWAGVMDPLWMSCVVLAIVFVIVGWILIAITIDEHPLILLTAILICLVLFIGSLCGVVFIPNKTTFVAMKVIPVIINNDRVSKLPDKVLDIVDDYLEELKPNKDKND